MAHEARVGGCRRAPATQTCELAANDASNDSPVVDAGIDAPPPSTFMYRRRITITNVGMSALPAGYTIRIPLTQLSTWVNQGKVKSDYSDLRVIGDNAIGERNRIIDQAPAPVALNFSIAAAIGAGSTNSEYALYYGAPAAGAAPENGNAVFVLFDDFTTGISSVWLKNDGPATSQGRLILRAGHTDAITTNAAADAVPMISAFEILATIVNPSSDPTMQPEGTFWYWFGYQHLGDFSASDPWIVWIARGKDTIQGEQKSPVGCEANCTGPLLPQNTSAHYYMIERDPTQTKFSLDGNLQYAPAVMNTTDYSLMIRNYMATGQVLIDWVRARIRVVPEPSATLGNEEGL